MILRVTRYGEPVLRRKCERVERFDDALKDLVSSMFETMYEEGGVGLAAPQVDVEQLVFVLDVSQLEPEDLDYELDGKCPPIDLIMPMAMVNPVVKLLPGPPVWGEEGCLSIPGLRGEVPRAEHVEVTFQDVGGAPHQLRAGGWFARVIQHEFDHLQGVLFIDHLEARDARRLDARLKRMKRESRDFLAATPKAAPPKA